jgi:hypothetical protein
MRNPGFPGSQEPRSLAALGMTPSGVAWVPAEAFRKTIPGSKLVGEMKLTARTERHRLTSIHNLQAIAQCAGHQTCYNRKL